MTPLPKSLEIVPALFPTIYWNRTVDIDHLAFADGEKGNPTFLVHFVIKRFFTLWNRSFKLWFLRFVARRPARSRCLSFLCAVGIEVSSQTQESKGGKYMMPAKDWGGFHAWHPIPNRRGGGQEIPQICGQTGVGYKRKFVSKRRFVSGGWYVSEENNIVKNHVNVPTFAKRKYRTFRFLEQTLV